MIRLRLHFYTLLISLLALTIANGQSTDSTDTSIPETWDKFHIAPRIGVGIQKSFFTEIGLSLQRYVYEARHGFMVSTLYAAFEWTPSIPGQRPVYGIKAGAELVNNGGAGGIEIKYLTDSDSSDVVITPRFGFGLGFANIFYGYNFSTNKYPFPKIGKHQFSLVINTNILFYHSRSKKK
jgi:hypothetical protein